MKNLTALSSKIENYLIQKEFKQVKVFDNMFFIKENIKIEKIHCGYLCNCPYVVIRNVEQLKTIFK